MYQATVLYAPASEEMNALSAAIDHGLPRDRFTVVRKEASEAAIPDLAAADLVLLGSTAQGQAEIHEDFSEIVRALEGMSLAGRVVGIFALRSESTVRAFSRVLQDCEIPLAPRQVLVVPAVDAAEAKLAPWLDNLIAQLEAREHGA